MLRKKGMPVPLFTTLKSKSTQVRNITLVAPLISLVLVGCSAQPDAPKTQSDIDALTTILTGEFDSGLQMREDIANQVDKKNAHFWVNRVFVKPDAPQLNGPVLVGSTRYGPPWTFDDNEFLVWSFTPDPESDGILMSPSRLKDLEALKPQARVAETFAALKPDDLEAAISGAACDIIWTRSDTGFLGESKPCAVMSTTHKKMMDWIWKYKLTQDALYVEFAGTDENGSVLDGTPPNAPYRLDRLSDSAEFTNGHHILFNPTKREDISEAIKFLELAVAEKPDHGASKIALSYAYLRQNKYADAAAMVDKAKQLDGLSAHDQNWLVALDARIADDYPQEIAAWDRVLETDPDNRWALYELASMHYRSSDYAKTVEAIEKALEIEPDETKWAASFIYYLHSKSLYRMGNYEAAITAAEPGVRTEATRRATFYRKAMAQIATGDITDPTDALATYYEYSKRNGKVNEASYHAGVSLFFFELGDYDKAVEAARLGYEISKGPYQSWALGYAMTEQGNSVEGLEIIDEALTRFPENAFLMAGQGWAHYRRGDMEKAHTSLLAAQSASKRKNSGVERDLKIVKNALENPNAEQVPAVRWFGD